MDCEKIIQLILSSQNQNNWVDILSALLVPTIAIFGSLIAFLQWRINRARLKNELFDRRYQQFTVIKEFLGSIMSSGKVNRDEEHKYLVGTRGIRFIFDKKIADYIEQKIWHLAVELETLDAELEGVPVGDERTKNVHRQADIKKQLYQEFENLEELFSPYLQLKH
jgi:hypothetical protein